MTVSGNGYRLVVRFGYAHRIGLIPFVGSMNKKFQILIRNTNSSSGTERIEIKANQFASKLLIPLFLLSSLLGRYDINDDEQLQRLVRMFRIFRVSRQALEYRIRNI